MWEILALIGGEPEMPAKKPLELQSGHDTLDEKNQRFSEENRMKSERNLPSSAPQELKKHPEAKAAWKRLMREFNAIDGRIVTAQDRDLVLGLCMSIQEEAQLVEMRVSAFKLWQELQTAAGGFEDLVEFLGEEEGLGRSAEKELYKEALEWVNRVQAAYKTVLDLDSRLDRKRAMIRDYLEKLYLTPRSRAGVAAPVKDTPDKEIDPMEALLATPVAQFAVLANAGGKRAV